MKKILFVLACVFAAAPTSSFASSGNCNYTSMEAQLVFNLNLSLTDAHAYRLAMENYNVNKTLLGVALPSGSTVYTVDTKKLEKYLLNTLNISKARADYFVMTIEMARDVAAQYGVESSDPNCIE